MKTILFPHNLRAIGWILFITATILGIAQIGSFLPICDLANIICNDIAIIGTAIGSLLITCSREKVEDEMTHSIRLSSLLKSIYIWTGLIILSTIFFNGLDYLLIMEINLVLLPALFVFLFRLEMYRYHKINKDEE